MNGQAARGLWTPGLVLGFAFSGLFDGILLHQILQWHHLLSLVEAEGLRDLRVQVLADGAFHMLMYFVAAAGLWLLWSRRALSAEAGAGRRLAAAFIVGFGAWNVVDAVLFHWVLQIHHIRLAPEQALISDVAWLVVFGAVPLAVGWRLARRQGGASHGGPPGALTAGVLALAIVGSAGVASVPTRSPWTAVLVRPGLTDAEMLGMMAAVDGRLSWADRTGSVLVMTMDRPGDRWRLYLHGALLVGGAGPAGCLSWAQA